MEAVFLSLPSLSRMLCGVIAGLWELFFSVGFSQDVVVFFDSSTKCGKVLCSGVRLEWVA